MKIYKAEQAIADRIRANAKSSIIAQCQISDAGSNEAVANTLCDEKVSKNLSQNTVEKIKSSLTDPHPKMMYGSAILTSTVMNLNDDIFIPSHTWAAKATCLHTPFNKQHVAEDIIGHIIDYRILNEKLEVIDSEEVPEFFHIEVDWAIYEFIFPEDAEAIKEKFEDGKAFVSMECYLDDFDYGIVSEGAIQVVARNEATAFLTQKLRCYGGSGEVDGKRIGRILKKITFAGMGDVDNPANPDSSYTDIKDFSITKAENLNFVMYNTNEDTKSSNNTVYYSKKGKKMKTFDTVEKAQEYIDELLAKIDEYKTSEQTEAFDALKAEKESLEAAVETLKSEKSDLETQVADLTKTVKDTKAELDKKSEALEDIETTKKAEDRLGQLEEAGASFKDRDKQIAKLKKMTDEDFEFALELAAQAKQETKDEVVDPLETAEVDKDNDIEANASVETEDEADEAVATAKALAFKLLKKTAKSE